MASRPDALTSTRSVAKSIPGSLVVAAVVFQVVWLYWIYDQPMPNAVNTGGRLTRSYFLWRLLPQVVPGVKWRETFLAQTLSIFADPRHVGQRVPILLIGGYILAAALALGRSLLRTIKVSDGFSWAERWGVAFGLGTAGLAWITLVLGRFGLLSPWSVRLGLLVPIAVEAWPTFRRRGEPAKAPPRASAWTVLSLALVVAPFIVAMALGSMLPSIDFDAIEYHIQGPKEYYQNGRIGFLPHNVYTSMPFAVEMLHLLGMEVCDDWWRGALVGQLLNACFAPAAGMMIWATLRRWGSDRAAWFGTVAYLSTPWIYRLAAIPYVEGPLSFQHAALIWATGRAFEASNQVRNRFWFLAGLFAGGAMAIKYPALISAVLPFGAASVLGSWRAKSVRPMLAFGLAVGLVTAPWLIKNVVDTVNPVYPLGYKVFGGRYWDAEMDAKWAAAHGPRPIQGKAFVDSALEVAGRSDWQSPIYGAFAPLAFLCVARRRLVPPVAAFALYVFGTWWFFTHRLDRFWIPLMPALAILAGVGADWISARGWRIWTGTILAFVLVTNFVYVASPMAAFNEWLVDLNRLRRSVPAMLNPALDKMDRILPAGAKPLLVAQAAVFHLNRPIVYNTVFNKETIEEISKGKTPAEFRANLKGMGVTHVYVDWPEVERYRSPGNYGFTPYVVPALFESWVEAGVLGPPTTLGPGRVLYEVR